MNKEQREAITLALEALDDFLKAYYTGSIAIDCENAEKAITKLKQVLSKDEEQEPVAWLNPYGGILQRLSTGLEKNTYTIPLYTTPPQRKPLTDEEIDAMAVGFSKWMFSPETRQRDYDRAIARAIEAAHGIKGDKT